MVVSGREISEVKRIVADFDQQAFVSVINVHEVEGKASLIYVLNHDFCNARQQNQKDNPILPSYLIIKKNRKKLDFSRTLLQTTNARCWESSSFLRFFSVPLVLLLHIALLIALLMTFSF